MCGGQRQLHQDAVHLRIGIERIDAGQQLPFGSAGRHVVKLRMDAGVLAGQDLVAHIDLGGGIVSHQHHGDTRLDAMQ